MAGWTMALRFVWEDLVEGSKKCGDARKAIRPRKISVESSTHAAANDTTRTIAATAYTLEDFGIGISVELNAPNEVRREAPRRWCWGCGSPPARGRALAVGDPLGDTFPRAVDGHGPSRRS